MFLEKRDKCNIFLRHEVLLTFYKTFSIKRSLILLFLVFEVNEFFKKNLISSF
jgi:hypothetical protein